MQHQYHLLLLSKSYPLLRFFLERMALVEVLKIFIPNHFSGCICFHLKSYISGSSFITQVISYPNLGAQKLARIRENSNFFRSELQKMGFEVLGDNDSPVMPIMLYNPAKIPAFSRECLKQNVSL